MKPTTNPNELLNNLFFSVQRAGPVFTGQGRAVLQDKGYHVTLQLAPHAFNDNDVGRKVRAALGSYIRSYLKESGWRVKHAGFKKGYFELMAAPR